MSYPLKTQQFKASVLMNRESYLLFFTVVADVVTFVNRYFLVSLTLELLLCAVSNKDRLTTGVAYVPFRIVASLSHLSLSDCGF